METGSGRTPLTTLKGVGDKVSKKFANLGAGSVEDLPFLIPRAYQDRSNPHPIPMLVPGGTFTIRGKVMSLYEKRYRRRGTLEIMVSDGKGVLMLKWFRYSRWLKKNLDDNFPVGSEIIATGRVDTFAGQFQMYHPEMASPGDGEGQGIVPIYPLTEGLSQRAVKRAVEQSLDMVGDHFQEFIPLKELDELSLPDLVTSIGSLHNPPVGSDVEALNRGDSPWHRRLKFGELLLFQLGLLQRRRSVRQIPGFPVESEGELEKKLRESLPFTLTEGQERVLKEIITDLSRGVPMQRLLQGDVGSGKTLVAFICMLHAVESGRQAALMVPTEVLAEQHFSNMSRWAEELGISSVLLTGSMSSKEKKEALNIITSGLPVAVVGTHALIQEGVDFPSLALVVVDEQHRFGVVQRLALRKKGESPHFLVMTATPIPRSLAMVLYGDLDVSILDEMPPGRKPVQTIIFSESDRAKLHLVIAREVKDSNLVFIVYPLVEETEKSELSAASEMADRYRKQIFPNLKIGLLTGRMPADEKERVMSDFRNGRYQVLVATTVIEVGVDVPDATLMVVEHAERFGLFQLHQLRGRVGRGLRPSKCILVASESVTPEAKERLAVMTRSTSGFEIAEEDLKMRGPGDFFGVRQAGFPDLRYAHPIRDRALFLSARDTGERLLEKGGDEAQSLQKSVEEFWSGKLELPSSG